MAGSSRTRLKVACRKAVIRRINGWEISRASSPTGFGRLGEVTTGCFVVLQSQILDLADWPV